jgi:hypothetical protein
MAKVIKNYHFGNTIQIFILNGMLFAFLPTVDDMTSKGFKVLIIQIHKINYKYQVSQTTEPLIGYSVCWQP